MFVFNVYLNDRLVHFNIPLNRKVLLGSDQGNTVWLPDPSVSSQHASLEESETDRKVVVTDGVESSGTYVNGARIQQRTVGPGDTNRLGTYTLEILKAHKRLWWSLEILRAHGGNLRVESPDPDFGVGTRVEFAFPEERVREHQEA